MLWVWLVLLYGIIKGMREIVKKKSMEKSPVLEVLFFYTVLSFLVVAPTAPKAAGVDGGMMLLIAIKSFVIFIAWMMGFKALRKLPVSLYGLLDLSRVIFSMLMGVVFLREVMHAGQVLGLLLVCAGLLMSRYGERFSKTPEPSKAEGEAEGSIKLIFFVLCSAFLNGVSGTMDKAMMQTDRLTTTQMQFWYMLFLVLFYGGYILTMREKVCFGRAVKNGWIWLLSILFVIGDKALFIANRSPDSNVTVMTLLKQVCCVVTILAGRFLFKEKNIWYKLCCAAVIITGIVVAVI